MLQKFSFLLLILFLGCPMLQAQGTTEIMHGTLVTKKFVNKIGKTIEYPEIFFQVHDQYFFVKLSESSVPQHELEKWINKPVSLKVLKKEGLWDAKDASEEVQSRTGEYIIVLEIIN